MGFGPAIQIAKIFGIPIKISLSWLVILALVTFSLEQELNFFYPRWSFLEVWSTAAAAAVLFFASVITHELSHSLLAIRKGIPVHGITLFILGGVSQLDHEAPNPLSEFLVAIVGPLSSLLLSALFFGLMLLVKPLNAHAEALFLILTQTNLVLGLFNFAPAFPLDGGRVLRAALWHFTRSRRRATTIAGRISQGFAVLMIGAGLFYGTVFSDGSLLSGLWLVLIGWFLFTTASQSMRQEHVQDELSSLHARDIVAANVPVLAEQDTVQSAAAALLRSHTPFILLQTRASSPACCSPPPSASFHAPCGALLKSAPWQWPSLDCPPSRQTRLHPGWWSCSQKPTLPPLSSPTSLHSTELPRKKASAPSSASSSSWASTATPANQLSPHPQTPQEQTSEAMP
ncbi:MAG: hypothetical protein EXR67_00700 [Dehalococcoidia bacterium]|nr:hypothetical protein [Dehalococcoidia bacterium]